MNLVPNFRYLATSLLLAVICGACTPKPPNSVPDGAIFLPTGSAAWRHCEHYDGVEDGGWFKCRIFDERGAELGAADYFSISALGSFNSLRSYPSLFDELKKWNLDSTWWKGEHLLLAYKVITFPAAGGQNKQTVVIFGRQECVELLRERKLHEFDELLRKGFDDTASVNPDAPFGRQLADMEDSLGTPVSAESLSTCLILYRFK